MAASPRAQEPPLPASAEAMQQSIRQRFAVRVHVALILAGCFVVGLAATKLLLVLGVHAMWLRYTVALLAAYGAFLLGVKAWLRYAGFDRPVLPGRRSSAVRDAVDGLDLGSSGGGGGGGKGIDLPVFRGGGGGSGGGGASANFGNASFASSQSSSAPLFGGGSSSRGGSGGGFSLDLGDSGWVLVALIALLAAVFGAVAWILYAAPAILGDAAFAALLSAGLVRSTRHIAGGGWIASVVGHTWLAFLAVFVLALVFALVAQHRFPDAHTILDVVRRL